MSGNVSRKSGNKRRRLIKLGSFQDDLCFFCDAPMTYLDAERWYDGTEEITQQPLNASQDHYVSRKDGGNGSRINTVVAHRQCNSEMGHQPKTPELDEKLRKLNIRRGYGDENGVVDPKEMNSRLTPDTFGKNSPALLYLCDLANSVEGKDGQTLRRTISRRLLEHNLLLRGTEGLSPAGFRREVVDAVRVNLDAKKQVDLPPPFKTLVANVVQTLTKQAIHDTASK